VKLDTAEGFWSLRGVNFGVWRPERTAMKIVKTAMARLLSETEGQDLIEYALLAGTIAIAVTAAMGLVSGALNNEFNTVANSIGS
jgi:Flp pilus assembly pilin Flp